MSKLIGLGIILPGDAIHLVRQLASIAVTHSTYMYKFFTQN